jgi:hypothetical protein
MNVTGHLFDSLREKVAAAIEGMHRAALDTRRR